MEDYSNESALISILIGVGVVAFFIFFFSTIFHTRKVIHQKTKYCSRCEGECIHRPVRYQDRSTAEMFSPKAVSYFWQCEECGKLTNRPVSGDVLIVTGRRITDKEFDLFTDDS